LRSSRLQSRRNTKRCSSKIKFPTIPVEHYLNTSTEIIMPEEKKYAHTNGFANGHGNGGLPPESPDGEMFLFTSESVGEGHPGKIIYLINLIS